VVQQGFAGVVVVTTAMLQVCLKLLLLFLCWLLLIQAPVCIGTTSQECAKAARLVT
jgi:hypothetical protein